MKKCISLILATLIVALPITSLAVNDRRSDNPSAWARDDISQVILLGLVPDEMQNAYDKPTTRQEFCRLIVGLSGSWHAAGKTDDIKKIASSRGIDPEKTVFSDTTDPNVILCAALGIVNGRGNGIFDPDEPITRQEAAKMLYNTADKLTPLAANEATKFSVPPSLFPHVFSDGNRIQSFARNSIYWVYRQGIMKGLPGNAFDPDGTYTREQTYLTILRLYNSLADPAKNNLPKPEYYPYRDGYIDSYGKTYTKEQKGYIYPFDQEYETVLDNPANIMNPGSHIIDRKGKIVLTDFKGTNGHFLFAEVAGNLAMLYYEGAPYTYVVNLKTGAVYENAQFGKPSDGMTVFFADQKWGYFNASGEVAIKPQYEDTGDFLDGKAVVQDQNGNWDVIDQKGKVIKANFMDTKKYTVMNHADNRKGETVVVQNSDNKCAVFDGIKGLLTGFDYDGITCCQNGQFLCENGNNQYVLLDNAGKQISKTYQIEIRQLDNSCYITYQSDPNEDGFSSFAIINQTGKEILVSEAFRDVQADGEGLYTYAKDKTHCVIVDSQGSTIGSIEREHEIASFGFVNGLLYVTDNDNQIYYDTYYYLFDGTPLFNYPKEI